MASALFMLLPSESLRRRYNLSEIAFNFTVGLMVHFESAGDCIKQRDRLLIFSAFLIGVTFSTDVDIAEPISTVFSSFIFIILPCPIRHDLKFCTLNRRVFFFYIRRSPLAPHSLPLRGRWQDEVLTERGFFSFIFHHLTVSHLVRFKVLHFKSACF